MRFFKDPGFEFDARIALGGVRYGAGDVGEMLTAIDAIEDGTAESWFVAWSALGERILGIAQACEREGHRESARDAYLRAAAYLFTATGSLDGTDDPSRLVPTWRRHREAWARWCALSQPEVREISIPFEGTALKGFVFRPAGATGRLPTVILNNGSDGPVHAMWCEGGAAAVARGYLAVTFDGPGQGHALFEQGLPFRHDWEAVITPVVDHLLGRDDVDPNRIVLHGVSQAGYWVPRAVAFEHRIAAAVADPGVMDVATSWLANLPQPVIDLLDQGDRATFDQAISEGLESDPRARQVLGFRMRPYGTTDPFDAFTAVRRYRLGDELGDITCPMLITDPEGEQFWPGQSEQLHAALSSPSTLVRFTAAEGADMHCEPLALSLRDQRVFDWLDLTLRRVGPAT